MCVDLSRENLTIYRFRYKKKKNVLNVHARRHHGRCHVRQGATGGVTVALDRTGGGAGSGGQASESCAWRTSRFFGGST